CAPTVPAAISAAIREVSSMAASLVPVPWPPLVPPRAAVRPDPSASATVATRVRPPCAARCSRGPACPARLPVAAPEASTAPSTNVHVAPRRMRRGIPNDDGPDMAGSLGQKGAVYGRLTCDVADDTRRAVRMRGRRTAVDGRRAGVRGRAPYDRAS